MSSSDRRAVLRLLAAAPLAACGFTPAYAPGGPAAGLRNAIRPDDPTDKNGFDLVAELEAKLGRAETPRYTLSYTIGAGTAGLGITTSGVTTRYDIVGSAGFVLHDDATGKTLTEGSVSGFTSYSAAGSTVSTLIDQEAAQSRLMVILADQIVARLVATSGTWAK